MNIRGRLSPAGAAIDSALIAVLRRVPGTSPVDVMQVRMILEPQAAEAAATQASEAALLSMRDAHEQATRAEEMEAFERHDAQFHRRLFIATRNELLTNLDRMVQLIRGQPPWAEIKRRSFSEGRRLAYCREHADILDALERRDGRGAAESMRTHLQSVARNLFGSKL